MKKRLVVAMIALAVLAASEVVLPWLIADAVARGMATLIQSSSVSAKAAKTPALFMLGGSFDAIEIRAADAKVDRITFSELNAVLRDVQVDMAGLTAGRGIRLEKVREAELAGVITQEELARYLNQTVKGIRNAAVNVSPGKVQVSSVFSLGGIASIAVTLDGKIVSDGQRIKFVTDRFLLNNTAVGNIGGAVLTEIPLLEMNKLPFGVKVKDIKMESGRVTVIADNKPQ